MDRKTAAKLEKKFNAHFAKSDPIEALNHQNFNSVMIGNKKVNLNFKTDEINEIVKKNEEAGLVMQPFNAQKVGGMCSCCGDCCGVLRSLNMHPSPAEMVQSNYFARVNEAECTGCETCVERCQIEAIELVDGLSTIDLNRCIGCGLCVTTCPVDAIELIQKPEDQLYEPPKTGAETYIRIMQERGII